MKKKIRHYILSFSIAILIFLIGATIAGKVPFGKYLFNIYDSYTMYPSLLVSSLRALKNGNIFYVLGAGLGTDFYSIKSLYMNSPLNLLFLFCKKDNLFMFYTFLIYLRIGLSSLTMCIYLNYVSKEKYKLKQIVFSIIYALSTYAIACSVHIMWMDSFVLLPLIILGLNKLIFEEKPFTYLIFLTMAIIINFYIGFMLCIFCLLYFIYKSYILERLNIKTIKRFLITSLLCGLLSSFILVPIAYNLFLGRGNNFSLISLKGIGEFTFRSLIYNFFPASYVKQDNFSAGSALVGSSIIILVLNIIYYFNKSINKKERVASLVITLFFFTSFVIRAIDFSWNMFQPPVWWSHRYSFVFTFLLIEIAYHSFSKIKNIILSKKQKLIILICVAILLILSFSYKTMGLFLSDYYVLYMFIGLVIFTIYLYFYHHKKAQIVLLFIVFIELIFNSYHILNINGNVTLEESKTYIEKEQIIEKVKEYDDSFYRFIITDQKDDDGLLFDYNTISLFSSSYNERVRNLYFNKLGINDNGINHLAFKFNNPAILPLLNVKYIYGNSEYYKIINDDLKFHEIPNSLSIGFVVPNSFKDIKLEDYQTYQNITNIYEGLLDEDIKLFYDIDYELNYHNLKEVNNKIEMTQFYRDSYIVSYDFVAPISGVLVPRNAHYYKDITVMINQSDKEKDLIDGNNIKFNNEYSDNIIYVKEGDKVSVKFDITFLDGLTENNWFELKILDSKALNEALEKISSVSQLENIKTDKHVLEGNITLEEDSSLLLSIPYQKGFKIMVDDKVVNYYEILDTFIGLNISKGTHKIKVDYIPYGFKTGVILSSLGVLLTGIYYVFWKNLKK